MAKEIIKKAGVSGNSVAGKSFQIFTVSEELLAKVVEAVQAGEKEARSSGNVQSFEVFCHGFRQNISLGRIMIVPAKVCSDRKNFPTALLHGTLIRIFGWGGEEIADLVDKKIGESEFDEYSQADFDSLKESIFKDVRTGEEASLIVFAPNWMNSREYICFHFSKDADELKNNLRHQVFSAYYNPAVSSAFNALMTNVDTTKVDVTDITPKLSYPFLTDNPLKQFPQLEKSAGYKKATILLNRKTADEITKQTLDPQELDVFDSLNQALEQSLMPSADGAQGEDGFKAPEAKPGVPREASAKIAHIDANGICPGCKKAGSECACAGCTCKSACAPHETPFTNVGPGSAANDAQEASASAMKETVGEDNPEHRKVDGDPIGIAIDETGVPRSKADEEKVAGKKATPANNPSNRQRNSAHPETLRVDPTRLSSAYSAAYNGGFVDKHNMPPQKVKDYITDKMGNNDEYAPHAAADHKKEIAAGGYGEDPLTRRSNEKWGSAEIPSKTKRSNVEIMASYVADVVAAEIDEPSEAISAKSASARVKKESLLDKFRPKTAVELDIDSIWDAITEDMGPAPLVDVESDPSNPAPSNTEDQGGWSETTEEGSESEAPKGRPNKKDVQDLPEAFRTTEPEDKKEISDSEAESQETDLENSVTQEEEHYHGASVDNKYADFVEDVAGEIEGEEELPRMGCDQCEMMQINGVPCHETGCPNMGARWDAENGMWIKQRECFECGSEVDYDDPCCSAPVEDEAEEARWASAEKKADTADNGYDIDSAANPSSKENGPSDTVECHQEYNTETSEGTDRPKPEAGADIKQAGGYKRVYENEHADEYKAEEEGAKKQEGFRKEHMLHNIQKGDRVTILVPAGIGRGGQEWSEATGTAVMPSALKGGWVLNMGGQHGTPGVANENNIVNVRRGKQGADISGDAAEAKAETVSPDTVDKDIQQPTVSVEEAGKKGADKTALHFMNEFDIDDAVRTLGNDPVLGKAVRFLSEFKDQVNSHSDGWAYWRAPVAAAGQLMTLIEQGMQVKRGQMFQETAPLINDKAIAKALGPIKAFMTRKGTAAGMQMPKLAADISGDMSEAKSEVDYNKADMADEPKATDTVNPDHFAAIDDEGNAVAKPTKSYTDVGKDNREAVGRFAAIGERHDDVPVSEGDIPNEKQPKSDLSGVQPEAHDVPPQVDSKVACGESQPESVEFDWGAGDLADIVLVETEEAEEEK